jgi:hypothetical protein
MDLKKLIKETTQDLKLKKSCSCGCNTCEDTRSLAPILNESIAPREILSEGLKHHITQNKPLTENIYRAGSENYFNLWAEARSLYSRRILEIQNEDDLEILTETNLGEFGILEDGTKIPLDFPMEEENKDKKEQLEKAILNAQEELKRFDDNFEKGYIKIHIHDYNIKRRHLVDELILARQRLSDFRNITESKNENKPIGKPMRGGPKKFYVYVRDPKTKKVKKVSFGGTTGLSVKINDPKARKSFAARHDCANKKDRTKPSYWSCNIGKYWKQLGGEKNFSGYW